MVEPQGRWQIHHKTRAQRPGHCAQRLVWPGQRMWQVSGLNYRSLALSVLYKDSNVVVIFLDLLEAPDTKTNSLCVQTHMATKLFWYWFCIYICNTVDLYDPFPFHLVMWLVRFCQTRTVTRSLRTFRNSDWGWREVANGSIPLNMLRYTGKGLNQKQAFCRFVRLWIRKISTLLVKRLENLKPLKMKRKLIVLW